MTGRRLTRLLAAALAVLALVFAAGAVLAVATAGNPEVTLNEDDTSVPVTLTGTTDTGAGTVDFAITTDPTSGTIDEGTNATGTLTCDAGSCTGTVHYTPTANDNGSDSFNYTVTDGDGTSSPGTVSLTINPVNDAPSFTGGGDVTVDEDSGAYSAAWATNMSAGPSNESGQALDFQLTTDSNSALFATEPAVAADGTLTFTPAANANGSATIGFRLHDDGGTANGGIDLSAEQTFTLTVNPVNDPPTFSNAGDVTVNEDSGAYSATWASGISPGPSDESSQTVSFGITGNDNTALFSAQPAVATDGTLTFTPAPNANGVAHMTVIAHDSAGADSTGASLTITVNSVNDPPTFSDSGDVTVNEDTAYDAPWASSIVVGPTNEGDQTVQFTISNDTNAALFSIAPAVAADGTLSFTPAANANGSADIDVTAVDSGGTTNGGNDTSTTHTVTITITSVNDPPTFAAGPNEVVNHDTGAFTASTWATSISPGPLDESGQSVSFSFTADDNQALFAVLPAVAPDGTLTFTPAAGKTGTANLTLTAQDDGGTANGGIDTSPGVAVVIRVNADPNAVNDTFNVPEGSAGTSLAVLANDTSLPDPPETLTVTAVTQGVHGTVTIPAGGAAVTYKPVAMYYGSDFFSYTISDPGGLTDTATVFVTIDKDTTAPVMSGVTQRFHTGVAMSSTTLPGRVTWTGSDAGVGIAQFQVQRSVNGGAWASMALPSPTSTALNVGYTIGSNTYRFRARAIDRNGNVGGWAYTPTFHNAHYQETSTVIRYGGTWFITYNTADYGGAARYTTVAGRYAQITRTFRDIAVVAPRSSGRGSIYVYLDGVKVATVSLRNSTTQYRMVLWTAHFGSYSTHTVRIVAAGSVRVDLDAFITLY